MNRQTMRKAEIVFGFLLLAFVVVFLVSSVGLHPDAAQLPRLTAFFGVFFLLWSIWETWCGYRKAAANPAEDEAQKPMKPIPLKKICVSLFFMALLVVSWQLIGYLLGGVLVICAFTYFLGERRPMVLTLVPICSTLVLYGIFSKMYLLPLPVGILMRGLGF